MYTVCYGGIKECVGKGCKLYLESGRAREGDWGNFCDISEIEPSNPGPLIGSD